MSDISDMVAALVEMRGLDPDEAVAEMRRRFPNCDDSQLAHAFNIDTERLAEETEEYNLRIQEIEREIAAATSPHPPRSLSLH
jgi:hypothetical protein